MTSPGRGDRSATRQAGLTLIEATLIVCIAGILLAAGIPAFVRALHTSKLAEAPSELQRIYAAAASYYAASPARGTESNTAARGHCLPDSAGPTPDKPGQSPVVVDFAGKAVPGADTWKALGYQPQQPIRYRYSVHVKRPGCGITRDPHGPFSLSVRAEGDLDGDGMLSLFERNARVENGTLVADPLLVTRDAVE